MRALWLMITTAVAGFAQEIALPATTAQQWGMDAAAAFQAALAQSQQLTQVAPVDGGVGWGIIAAGVGTAALLAVRFGKNLPGIAGMAFALGEAVWEAFAPAKCVDAQDVLTKKAQLADAIVNELTLIIEHMPNDASILELKAKMSALTSNPVREVLNKRVLELKDRRL